MARKYQVVLEDDLSGGVAVETVSFALDGRAYEIDLSQENAVALREVLAPWIKAGRRAGRPPAGAATRAARSARRSGDAADIRRWAAEQGFEVSARGRISAELRAAYEAAH